MIAYFLMAGLYLVLAALIAVDVALGSFRLLEWFKGLVWLRVHFITLGALTETFFGLLPVMTAAKAKRPRPATRWDIWLTLNAGFLTLLIGIPLVNKPLIFAGGTLVFIAASLLMKQLNALRASTPPAAGGAGSQTRKFYVVGVGYLLLGIFVGTGLWLNWSQALRIQTPMEVHIHANGWGFISLVFAALLIDLYPQMFGRPLGSERVVTGLFWGLTLGAFGLTMGPWFNSMTLSVVGLVFHLSATAWLMVRLGGLLRGDQKMQTPGVWHLFLSYVWIIVPVLFAPFVLLDIGNVPGPTIEANAPQALIYGWMLQFGYAILPYLFGKWLLTGGSPKLGGNRFSVIVVNLGGAFLWFSIFIQPYRALLHGSAYILWAISMIPIIIELWKILQAGTTLLREEEK